MVPVSGGAATAGTPGRGLARSGCFGSGCLGVDTSAGVSIVARDTDKEIT